jgi:hypothetical protein
MPKALHPAIKAWLSKRGRKGGLVKSTAKTEANRANELKRWAKKKAAK